MKSGLAQQKQHAGGQGHPHGGPAPEAPPVPFTKAAPVRVVGGFMAALPGRTRIFFQRTYFVQYPRPLQPASQAPFPVPIQVLRLRVPPQQSIVIKQVAFKVFVHSGIGINDIVAVDPTRVTTFFGFSFAAGNRGLTDFSTNVQAPNPPVVFNPAQPTGVTIQAGSSRLWPYAGPITPLLDNYAGYAMPGDLLAGDMSVMRAPDFDVRLIACSISGWLSNEEELQRIIDSLTR